MSSKIKPVEERLLVHLVEFDKSVLASYKTYDGRELSPTEVSQSSRPLLPLFVRCTTVCVMLMDVAYCVCVRMNVSLYLCVLVVIAHRGDVIRLLRERLRFPYWRAAVRVNLHRKC